ncbi:MAG: DUF6122 family protein [Bacteroidota bacterium]
MLSLSAVLHVALHVIVPLGVAWVLYRPRWRLAATIMVTTMVVDLDHLLADPIYDPARCSIGFHPLHTGSAALAYGLMWALPLVLRSRLEGPREEAAYCVHLVGLGLLIHLALDGLDCLGFP